jgi:crossover junction endodeoxyribonuclease RusA
MNAAIITIPPADPALNAHAKGHWRAKAKATAEQRALAKILAKQQPVRIKGKCRVHFEFYVPDRRRRDASNLVQSCKAAIDGVVDAGVIEGDHWEILTLGSVSVFVDKLDPRIVLMFEEV